MTAIAHELSGVAPLGSADRLTAARQAEAARRRQWTSAQRSAWRILDTGRARDAIGHVLDGYPDRLRTFDAAELHLEALRLDELPGSPAVAEMRTEVELERAGRRWHAVHAEAERIGWDAAIRLSIVAGVA